MKVKSQKFFELDIALADLKLVFYSVQSDELDWGAGGQVEGTIPRLIGTWLRLGLVGSD